MRLALKHRVENAHEDAVWTARWTPADSLITGSVDETVKVWVPADATDSIHTYTGEKYQFIERACHRAQHKAGCCVPLPSC